MIPRAERIRFVVCWLTAIVFGAVCVVLVAPTGPSQTLLGREFFVFLGVSGAFLLGLPYAFFLSCRALGSALWWTCVPTLVVALVCVWLSLTPFVSLSLLLAGAMTSTVFALIWLPVQMDLVPERCRRCLYALLPEQVYCPECGGCEREPGVNAAGEYRLSGRRVGFNAALSIGVVGAVAGVLLWWLELV